MRINLRLNQSGDTLVEVMLAAAVLSVVMAGAFTLTNRATRLVQSANERTEASNLMQREAELIRSKLAQSGSTFWATLDATAVGYLRAGPENNAFCTSGVNPDPRAFYMETVDPADPTNFDYLEPTLTDSPTFNDAVDDLFLVWVEAANESVPDPTYTDFFVYACWEGIGGEAMQSSGLVMRLSR